MPFMNGKQVNPQNPSPIPVKSLQINCRISMSSWRRVIFAFLSYYFGVSIARHHFFSSLRNSDCASLWTFQVTAFSTPSLNHQSTYKLIDPARQRCRPVITSVFGNNVAAASLHSSSRNNDVGGYDPSEGIEVSERIKEKSNVGNPQIQVREKEFSVTSILKELAAIQQQGPQKYCILGTRHCSYLHQQIIELLYVF